MTEAERQHVREVTDFLIGAAPLVLRGQTWRLAITHGVLMDFERASGISALHGVDLASGPARALQALLWAAMRRAGSPYSARDIGAMLTLRSIPRVREALMAAWNASMPERESGPSGPGAPESMSWTEMWSMGREMLGLSLDEWLEMSPRQFHSLHRRHIEYMQWAEMLAGIVASTTANFSDRAPQHPLTPASFMMHRIPEKRDPVTAEYIMAQFAKARNQRVQ